MFDNVRYVEYGSVVDGNFGIVGEKEMASYTTACFWFAEIARVTVRCEFCFACIVCEYSFLLCRKVVQQLFGVFHCVLGRRG